VADDDRRQIAPRRFTDRDVFHQRDRRKPAEAFKQCTAEKQSLIATGDVSDTTAQVDGRFDHTKYAGLVIEMEAKKAPLGIDWEVLVQVWRQAAVGMQKKQLPASCDLGPAVHLHGAAGSARHDATTMTSRDFEAVIIAAAITDDDLAVVGYEGQGE
jgi:hypothetical protein